MFVKDKDLLAMHHHVLNTKDYDDVQPPDLEVDRMRAEYPGLIKRITRGTPDGARRAFYRSFEPQVPR